jgi:hypothetical protein
MKHPYQFLVLAVAMAMPAMPCLAQQMTGPPFVERVTMTVIDPEDVAQEFGGITSFEALVQAADGGILALCRTGDQNLGVLVLDGKTLGIERVLQPLGKASGPWVWQGAARLGDKGVIAIASSAEIKRGASVDAKLVILGGGAPETVKIKPVVLPEAVSAVEFIPVSNALACLTKPSNALVSIEITTGETSLKRVIFDFVPYEYPCGRTLQRVPDGRVFGSYKGRLFSYQPKDKSFDYLGLLPCEFGHLSETALSAAASDGKNTFVGGVCGDGYLFSVDLATSRVTPRGRPSDATEIRCLVYAGETGFWGIAATPGLPGRLFHFQPKDGTLEDLGIPMGDLSREGSSWHWHAFAISAMIALADGRILLAEGGNQAKLLVFDPAQVLKR